MKIRVSQRKSVEVEVGDRWREKRPSHGRVSRRVFEIDVIGHIQDGAHEASWPFHAATPIFGRFVEEAGLKKLARIRLMAATLYDRYELLARRSPETTQEGAES